MAGVSPQTGESEESRRAIEQLRNGRFRDRPSRFSIPAITPDSLLAIWKSRTCRLVIAAVAVVVASIVCAVVLVQRSAPSALPTVEPPVTPVSIATTTTTGPGVVVDVGGAVRRPGVYRLSIGARVVDALEAAGGPAEDIDLDHINLASVVADGQRVWITRIGAPAPVVASGSESSTAANSASGPLDLNSATAAQLENLPGVGPATAKAILERRTQMGRFRSVDDLLTVKGIGEAKLDALRGGVVVR